MRKIVIFLVFAVSVSGYEIGVGISDVTGPIVEVTFMGYGNLDQRGTGLHLRQWSRAYIINDGTNRLAFVNVDAGMMGDGVRMQVLKRLQEKFGNLYNTDNVMISATHTHSGVGGFLFHTLFDISSFGFSSQTFEALVGGIVKSIAKAHNNLQKGRIYFIKGQVLDANINRSPTSYEANPYNERSKYPYNVDKELVQLKFISDNGQPLGVINWFPVHATSMNNSNTLVSSDNVGYASIKFEEIMNPGYVLGKGPFVASFASSNLGDVSPNVMGPKCHLSGKECDDYSTCEVRTDPCYAVGPGEDMFESTKIIAERLVEEAWNLWESPRAVEITGPVRSIHQYVDMPTAEAEYYNETTKSTQKIRGCVPAMGYSFGAGTIDGPYASLLRQGMTESWWWLDTARSILLGSPGPEDVECHAPKPILLPTGQMSFPFDWQPRIVSTQLGLIGNLALACVPGEFTTMAGRRMRDAVTQAIGNGTEAVLVGLCNTYSDYITTFEEYQIQRYEGASTLFGPHTLALYLDQFEKLGNSFASNVSLERGPEPVELVGEKMVSLIMPVVYDNPKWFHHFGDVLAQPEAKTEPGKTVKATFAAGHPRNDLKLDDTYCTVELLDGKSWTVVATDANWETKIHWRRTSYFLGMSEIDVEWTVPENAVAGFYRIKHFGSYKKIGGSIHPYEGTTKKFQVAPSSEVCRLICHVFLCSKI